MNRRHLITGLVAAALLPGSAMAQSYADRIVQQLRQQGYSGISVSNTWLGRTRIVGQSGQGSREIIIDPRTGEILRDLFSGGGSGHSIIDDDDRAARDAARDAADAADNLADEAEERAKDAERREGNSGGNSGSGGGDDEDED